MRALRRGGSASRRSAYPPAQGERVDGRPRPGGGVPEEGEPLRGGDRGGRRRAERSRAERRGAGHPARQGRQRDHHRRRAAGQAQPPVAVHPGPLHLARAEEGVPRQPHPVRGARQGGGQARLRQGPRGPAHDEAGDDPEAHEGGVRDPADAGVDPRHRAQDLLRRQPVRVREAGGGAGVGDHHEEQGAGGAGRHRGQGRRRQDQQGLPRPGGEVLDRREDQGPRRRPALLPPHRRRSGDRHATGGGDQGGLRPAADRRGVRRDRRRRRHLVGDQADRPSQGDDQELRRREAVDPVEAAPGEAAGRAGGLRDQPAHPGQDRGLRRQPGQGADRHLQPAGSWRSPRSRRPDTPSEQP